MRGQMTATDVLNAELDAVTGPRCGHSCEHQGAADGATHTCVRAANHEGAAVMIDVHVTRIDGGPPVAFDEQCCAPTRSVMT